VLGRKVAGTRRLVQLYSGCIVGVVSASYALLGILGHQSSYGYDLKRDYDNLYGRDKPLAFGQVYATLARLRRDEKVTIEATEQSGGPERKLYAITSTGWTDLERWLVRGRPSCWSPTTPASPRSPTARSSCATAGSPRH
jgi:DNA-binding PadR family transcriptional regulator